MTQLHCIALLGLCGSAGAQSALLEVIGQPGDALGERALALIDLDGDGRNEFGLVARPSFGDAETRVHRGSDGTLLKVIQGLPLQDVDGDGTPDRHSSPAQGAAQVLSADSGPSLWTVPDQAPSWGVEVVDLGDVNGDGASDLLVSDYAFPYQGTPSGAVVFTIYSGPDGATLHTWSSSDFSALQPQALPLGDVDGDGVSEIVEVVGTAARILRPDGVELSTLSLPVLHAELLTGGFLGADADGDGTPDFALSEYDQYAHEDRFTHVFSGATGGALGTFLGSRASFGGDLDGDGRADLALCDMPDVRVVSVASGSVLRTIRPSLASLGWSIPQGPAILGDLDGDGSGELLIASTGYPSSAGASQVRGRARVYAGDLDEEIGTAHSASGCPCGNSGAIGTGCANSSGAGARLFALGSHSVAEGHLILGAEGTPSLSEAVLFTGPALLGTPRPFGGGLRLMTGPVGRVATHINDQTGLWTWNDYHGFPQIEDQGFAPFEFNQSFQAGQTYYFQVWYTDLADPCGKGFNLTNAVELTMTP